MPFSLNKVFLPVTANAFQNDSYIEILPCEELLPYIRCFWGSKGNTVLHTNEVNVIPDVCCDIIINVDLGNNKFSEAFCGINNTPFISHKNTGSDSKFSFGIRFFSWSAVLFADESMRNSLNDYSPTDKYFRKLTDSIKNKLLYSKDIFQRKAIVESILLKKLDKSKENSDLMNTLYAMIKANGNITIKNIADEAFISKRQLERIYSEYIGVSPKQMLELIRYQMLWQDILNGQFDVNKAIEKFGFYDQSHLLKEFKKYHGINISCAKNNARNLSHFYNTD